MMEAQLADLLIGANRVVLYAGFVLVAGTFSFWVLVWPEGRHNRQQLLLVDLGLVLLAATTIIGPALTVVIAREAPFEVLSREVGASALLRLAVLATTFAYYDELVAAPILGRRRVFAAAGVVALSATMVASSDAITGDLIALKVVATMGHLLATAAWLGGLVALAVVIIPRQYLSELDELIPAFSRVAFVSVIVLVVTGAIHGLAQAGGLSGLATSGYGLVLLIKVLIFCGMLALGNHGRHYANQVVVHRLHADARDVGGGVQTLAVVMGAELATAGALLVTTAILVAVAPLG
jgi:copper transport protein